MKASQRGRHFIVVGHQHLLVATAAGCSVLLNLHLVIYMPCLLYRCPVHRPQYSASSTSLPCSSYLGH